MKKFIATLLATLVLVTATPALSFEFCQTIPDAQVTQLLDAWAAKMGYVPSKTIRNDAFDNTQPEGPGNERKITLQNPETKAQFVRRKFAEGHQAVLEDFVKRQAAQDAYDAAEVDTSGIN
jgi:hypothetical protein